MPLITCPYCSNAVTLPDPWTAPGFTCPHCRNTSAIAAPAASPAPLAPSWPSQPAPMELPLPEPEPPRSRAPSVRRPTPPAPTAEEEAKSKRLIILGYSAFVAVPTCLVIGIAAYKFGGTEEKQEPTEVVHGNPDAGKKPDPGPRRVTPQPPRKREPGIKHPDDDGMPGGDPVKKNDGNPTTPVDPKPVAGIELAPEPRLAAKAPEVVVMPMTPEIGLAPEPRAVRPVMEPPAGFVSDWEKVGDVEVRVRGVAVTRVPITNADKEDVDSPVPVLAVWIEVRTMSKARTVELRRWQDPLGQYCEMMTARLKPLERGLLGPGATLRTGLPYKQPVPADGTPRLDLLVFTAPVEGSGTLRLNLDAERVGETGKIRFAIPESAWKR